MYLGSTKLSVGECLGTWSSWFDRDDPSGTGDYEILSKLHDNKKLCDNPIAVEGRIKGSGETVTTQNVELTRTGLICRNNKQPVGKHCFDYEARFCCDKSGNINVTKDSSYSQF